MNPITKNVVLWLIIGLSSVVLLLSFFGPSQQAEKELIFSDFIVRVEQGEVEEVTGVLPITIPVKEICEELRRTPNEAGIYWTGAHWRIFIYRSGDDKSINL